MIGWHLKLTYGQMNWTLNNWTSIKGNKQPQGSVIQFPSNSTIIQGYNDNETDQKVKMTWYMISVYLVALFFILYTLNLAALVFPFCIKNHLALFIHHLDKTRSFVTFIDFHADKTLSRTCTTRTRYRIKQRTQNCLEATLGHVNWGVVYPLSSHKIILPSMDDP